MQHQQTPESIHNDLHWNLIEHRLGWAYAQEPPTEMLNVNYTQDSASHVWYVEQGRCLIKQDGRTMEVLPGQWVFAPASIFQRIYDPGSFVVAFSFLARWPNGISLLVAPDFLIFPKELGRDLIRRAQAIIKEVEHTVEGQANYFVARHWRQKMTASNYYGIEGAFRYWLSAFLEVAPRAGAVINDFTGQDSRVVTAIGLLNSWPMDNTMDLDAVCQKVGISRRRLNDLFKKEIKKGLREYYEDILTQRIQKLLIEDTRQIKEIGMLAGFVHCPNFTRWFNQRTGMTPSQFRANHNSMGIQ